MARVCRKRRRSDKLPINECLVSESEREVGKPERLVNVTI